jgi:hypothetical protein
MLTALFLVGGYWYYQRSKARVAAESEKGNETDTIPVLGAPPAMIERYSGYRDDSVPETLPPIVNMDPRASQHSFSNQQQNNTEGALLFLPLHSQISPNIIDFNAPNDAPPPFSPLDSPSTLGRPPRDHVLP